MKFIVNVVILNAQELNWFKQTFPEVPMMALTATATDRVKADVVTNLGMNHDKHLVFQQSFNRPNLMYSYSIYITSDNAMQL